jgi:drug/metabolite transporter (DMT)-like permease
VLSTKLGQFKAGMDFLEGNKSVLLIILLNAACVVTGQFLILTSISEKNATLSSMVEITYPIFVALFSWLLFRQFHLSWTSIIGGLMIMSGVFLIYLKN